MITTVLCYSATLGIAVTVYDTPCRVDMGNVGYNQTVSTLRTELERQSKEDYGIWTGGRYATHQDVAGLFFTRSVDLYLKDGGVIGMVMPHSALQTGQYAKWRTGAWRAKAIGTGKNRTPGRVLEVDFGYKTAWDLERLEPNTFFPVPASVVFAQRGGEGKAAPLAGEVERWLGKTGADDVRRTSLGITDTSVGGNSRYAEYSSQGVVIVPRCLFFIEEIENTGIVQAGQTITVNPRRGPYDREPWRSLDLTIITDQTIEHRHVFDTYLGETVVPYATREPLKAILPLKKGSTELPIASDGSGGVNPGGLERRMRERWQSVSHLWEQNKTAANKLNLLGQLDYYGKFSAQLEWQRDPGNRPLRVVYTGISGIPTAALVDDNEAIIDHALYWITCKDMQEANYVMAAINSDVLSAAVTPLMPKGQFGARDLHKHLWKLPIPEFDPANSLHAEVSDAGKAAAEGAAIQLATLQAERSRVTVTIARRELRKWLRNSPQGQAVEYAVTRLLAAE